jgi:phage terminase large subunit-like protein
VAVDVQRRRRPITKGPLAGKHLRLLPHQREFVDAIYGGKVRLAIQSLPRGNGKTGLLAGLCLCHLLGPEAEPRGEIYSAAIDRQQAGLMFAEMEAIILARPDFAARVNIQRFHKKIEVTFSDGEASVYEALTSDARRAHGLSPSFWCYDELAQAKDRVLFDNLVTAMGKRGDAIGVVISTQAPDSVHPLSELIDDPSVYSQVMSAPTDADIFDEQTWRACNPALGKFLSLKEMREAAARARSIPAFEPAFRNLRLNQRVDARSEDRIVTKEVWERGSVPLKALDGRECYGGLDLSAKHDLTALVLAFPDGDAVDVLPFFWTPEGQLASRRRDEADLMGLWIKQGHLFSIPGETIRTAYIAEQIAELAARYNLNAIGYDRWRIDDLKRDLSDIGCKTPLEAHGQGFRDMGPAIDVFVEKALAGKLRHAGHPVLRASVGSAVLVSDAAGNKKIDKDRSKHGAVARVDGGVALAMALAMMAKPAKISLDKLILMRGGLA